MERAPAAAVGFLNRYRRTAAAKNARDAGLWPPECLKSESRFGHRTARLYPLIGVHNCVRTPQGVGTLHQAIGGEARVLLLKARATKTLMGSTRRYRPMSVFPIEQIAPYSKGAP